LSAPDLTALGLTTPVFGGDGAPPSNVKEIFSTTGFRPPMNLVSPW
jgi:hypothetical protein